MKRTFFSRIKLSLEKDQNDACFTDVHKAFKSHKDAVTRLTPYHIFSEPSPNAKMQNKGRAMCHSSRSTLSSTVDVPYHSSQHVIGQVSRAAYEQE